VHTAVYDAWTPYTERAKPTAAAPRRRPESERTLDNKSEATSYAAYRTLVDLFPTQKASFDDLMMSLGFDPADTSTGKVSPSEIGNLAAQRVLEARRDDGSNQEHNYADTTNYEPVLNDPNHNHWQPLCLPLDKNPCTLQQFVAPHWGQVRPFALSSGSELRNEVAERTHQNGTPPTPPTTLLCWLLWGRSATSTSGLWRRRHGYISLRCWDRCCLMNRSAADWTELIFRA
jgi:hypothetical protein